MEPQETQGGGLQSSALYGAILTTQASFWTRARTGYLVDPTYGIGFMGLRLAQNIPGPIGKGAGALAQTMAVNFINPGIRDYHLLHSGNNAGNREAYRSFLRSQSRRLSTRNIWNWFTRNEYTGFHGEGFLLGKHSGSLAPRQSDAFVKKAAYQQAQHMWAYRNNPRVLREAAHSGAARTGVLGRVVNRMTFRGARTIANATGRSAAAIAGSIALQTGARALGWIGLGLLAYDVTRFAVHGSLAAMKGTRLISQSYQQLELGTPRMDTNAAATQRQRALQEINRSSLNARAALGDEARFMHQ